MASYVRQDGLGQVQAAMTPIRHTSGLHRPTHACLLGSSSPALPPFTLRCHGNAPRLSRTALSPPTWCQQAERPLEPNQIKLPMPRRSLQVSFTCNKCGDRTTRLVNPTAWDRGMVIAQCQKCGVWHKLRDQQGLVVEVTYTDEPDEEDKGMEVPDEAV